MSSSSPELSGEGVLEGDPAREAPTPEGVLAGGFHISVVRFILHRM